MSATAVVMDEGIGASRYLSYARIRGIPARNAILDTDSDWVSRQLLVTLEAILSGLLKQQDVYQTICKYQRLK